MQPLRNLLSFESIGWILLDPGIGHKLGGCWPMLLSKEFDHLQGSDFAQAVEELNKAIDRAEGLMWH